MTNRIIPVFHGQGMPPPWDTDISSLEYTMHQIDETARSELPWFPSVRAICNLQKEGTIPSSHSSLALFAINAARLQLYCRETDAEIVAAGGSSLGMHNAYQAAGWLSLEDAAMNVLHRGYFMDNWRTLLFQQEGRWVEPIDLYSTTPEQAAGERLLVSHVYAKSVNVALPLGVEGYRPLRVNIPFHTPYLLAASSSYGKWLDNFLFSRAAAGIDYTKYEVGPRKLPEKSVVVSDIDGRAMNPADFQHEAIVHLYRTVNFTKAVPELERLAGEHEARIIIFGVNRKAAEFMRSSFSTQAEMVYDDATMLKSVKLLQNKP